MSALVDEWITKAEQDYHSARRDYRARKFPNYDGAGFHAQYRYPGESASKADAKNAIKAMEQLRQRVRQKLDLRD